MSDFQGGQLGDVHQRDSAGGHIYHISGASLDQLIDVLQGNIRKLQERLEAVEEVERQHAQERQSMTRLITMLASEARSVRDVQSLLEKQMSAEQAERNHRRRWLDSVLVALLVLNAGDIVVRVVFRARLSRELARVSDNGNLASAQGETHGARS